MDEDRQVDEPPRYEEENTVTPPREGEVDLESLPLATLQRASELYSKRIQEFLGEDDSLERTLDFGHERGSDSSRHRDHWEVESRERVKFPKFDVT